MKKHTNIVGAFLLQAASTAVLFSSVAHVNAMETAKVVCGGGLGNKRCTDKNLEAKVVSKDERYGARCCSDTPFFRSKLQDQFGCCVHGGTVTNVSGPGLELAHIYKGEEWFCPKAVTYAEAVQYCSNMGTRMCTEEELNNKCAKSTGCALNGALVWASTDEASTLCPTTSPSIEASSTPSVAASSTPSVYSSMSPTMSPSSTPTICVENVAFGKQTAQSSNYQVGGGFSDVAVDGNTDGNYDNGSVTHTYEFSKDPWWTVDLGNGYLIESIAVWNRNAASHRLADFVLTISRDGVDVYTYTYLGIPAGGGTANEIKLSQPVIGDKVMIQIFGEERILSLAEVQVFAFCGSEITPSPTSSPSIKPTALPTVSPTASPTAGPTGSPTTSPTASPTSCPSACTTPGLDLEYPGLNVEYYDETLSSLPAGGLKSSFTPYKTDVVSEINFYNESIIDVNFATSGKSNYVASYFSGNLYFAAEGEEVTFCLQSDDGSKLYVDGVLVINNDGLHEVQEICGSTTVACSAFIEVEYFEYDGYALCKLFWDKPSREIIPASAWSRCAGPN